MSLVSSSGQTLHRGNLLYVPKADTNLARLQHYTKLKGRPSLISPPPISLMLGVCLPTYSSTCRSIQSIQLWVYTAGSCQIICSSCNVTRRICRLLIRYERSYTDSLNPIKLRIHWHPSIHYLGFGTMYVLVHFIPSTLTRRLLD